MKENSEKKTIFENYRYIKLTGNISVNLLIIPVVYAAWKFEYFFIFFCAYTTAFFHELFHIAAMKITGTSFKEIIFEPFGITAQISESSFFNSISELFVSAAGPAFNFLAVIFLLMIKKYLPAASYNFILSVNLSMGIFNLLPALPLDGGRVLRALLTLKFGVIRAYNFMLALSKYITVLLLLCSVIILFVYPFNLSLITITAFMLSNLCCERSALTKVILKDILSSKAVPESIHKKKTKTITVLDTTPARIILKVLSFDYYISIIVVNKKGQPLYLATETEVINLLINGGIRSKFSDLIFNKNFTL